MERVAIACLFLLFVVQVNGAPYSKYKRTCKDINCRSHQNCVMMENPCIRRGQRECGRYPGCEKIPEELTSCKTMYCPIGEKCLMETEGPKCFKISLNPNGFYSAGVRIVNDRR